MAYVPDPTDVNQPIGSVKAGTADEEFRALKAYLQGLVLGAVSSGPSVRQTALIGSQDANGDPNFLSAGTGLALNLAALDAPLALSYAAGSVAAGDLNYNEALGADVPDVVTGLAPSNLSYITKLFNGAWGHQLAPCQYGKVFDKTAQMLIRWPGINNAVTSTEDFGNALTFVGDAKLSTAVQILGLNTIALDGTGDYVDAPLPNLGKGSWEFVVGFRTASLAAAQNILALGNATGHGLLLRLNATGRLALFASSNGASFDIANGAAGATVLAINTTYFVRFVFDALAGTYRYYLSDNGAAEVQDVTVASALITATDAASFRIGASVVGGTEAFNGNIGFVAFRPWASFTSAQAAGPTVAPTFADVKTDFFSVPQMKMYEITAASTVAGTNPTMVSVNKLYLAETATGAATVSSVVNYAFKGHYDSGKFAVSANTPYAKTHGVGVPPENIRLFAYTVNGLIEGPVHLYVAAYVGLNYGAITRTTVSMMTQANLQTTDGLTNGVAANVVAARLIADRGW